MIVIGGSLGGMKALRILLQGLPETFAVPIAVTLHRHKDADDALVHLLQQECRLPVRDAVDKDPLEPGVYLAPPDYHLLVEPLHLSLSTDEPVQYARPSIDVLFDSAADAFGPAVIGIVLTGANQDGAEGAARVEAMGGTILVQDPETAESPVMPEAAIRATTAQHVLPVARMAALLMELTAARGNL